VRAEFNKIAMHGQTLEPCPLCAAPAEMWELVDEGGRATKFACCSHTDPFGPFDDMGGMLDLGCPLNQPPYHFHAARYVEAAQIWNAVAAYARAKRLAAGVA
jgi:hypothetical protein